MIGPARVDLGGIEVERGQIVEGISAIRLPGSSSPVA